MFLYINNCLTQLSPKTNKNYQKQKTLTEAQTVKSQNKRKFHGTLKSLRSGITRCIAPVATDYDQKLYQRQRQLRYSLSVLPADDGMSSAAAVPNGTFPKPYYSNWPRRAPQKSTTPAAATAGGMRAVRDLDTTQKTDELNY